MSKDLVIVESPAKAKTIEKYLGSNYQVKSSFGHIRDLPKKGISIDIEHDFTPTYEINVDKKKVVADLKKSAKQANAIWLASDEDREGEAIAWHLSKALDLKPANTKRIVFHEITKTAITNAIANPRDIDINLVDAQQARRILDRLVGYELSPVLWKKVRPGLSAGRVQSVAVRLIVEREREIKKFDQKSNFRVSAIFETKESDLPAELVTRFDELEKAKEFLEACIDSVFSIGAVDKKPSKRGPGAPYITSSLQQDAARQLGFSVKQTMTLAQRLYESGHITYMRTDSTILSEDALSAAEKYISSKYGKNYHTRRQFKTKQSNAQEAHEAIRPTDFNKTELGDDDGQRKLYKLVWRRALASQMADAQLDRTEITIKVSKSSEKFLAKGEVVIFDGFLKATGKGKEDVILPNLSVGQELKPKVITARQNYTKPPARYSEASLVKKLEDLGIGRPSTYAPTISTIQSRGYIELSDIEGKQRQVNVLTLENKVIKDSEEEETYGADRSKLLPTPLADVTTDFLVKNFNSVIDYDFTANAEKDLDKIADGKEKWVEMIKKFYGNFHPLVQESDNISREESTQTKQLGIDPSNKKPIFARYGRYGPMLQRGETKDEEKPTFASLPAGSTLEDITLEQALEMFKLPRTVGKTAKGEPITSNVGRYGPYIQVGKIFVSIKDSDPFKITEEEARTLYDDKLSKNTDKYIQKFKSNINVVNGPYGPYVTNGKRNVSIPDDKSPESITEAEAKELLAQAPKRKAPRRRRPKVSK